MKDGLVVRRLWLRRLCPTARPSHVRPLPGWAAALFAAVCVVMGSVAVSVPFASGQSSVCVVGDVEVESALPQAECDALFAIVDANRAVYGPRNFDVDPCVSRLIAVFCAEGHVVAVGLPDDISVVPPQIGALSELRSFEAIDGLFTELPDEFVSLGFLEEAFLQHM